MLPTARLHRGMHFSIQKLCSGVHVYFMLNILAYMVCTCSILRCYRCLCDKLYTKNHWSITSITDFLIRISRERRRGTYERGVYVCRRWELRRRALRVVSPAIHYPPASLLLADPFLLSLKKWKSTHWGSVLSFYRPGASEQLIRHLSIIYLINLKTTQMLKYIITYLLT